MRPILAVLIACSVIPAPTTAGAGDHLATTALARERLAQAQNQRRDDIRAVERALSTPAAAAAGAALGVPIEGLRAAVPTLSDRELRDLAARASSLESDPVAGFHDDSDLHDVAVLFLIVVMAALLINAVD